MCRRQSGGEELAGLVALLYLVCVAMMVTRWRPPRSYSTYTPNCAGCNYDLDGLADGLPCPECGSPTSHVKVVRSGSHLGWHGPRLVKWLMLLPLWAMLLLVLSACQQPLVALSYWVQGYGWQTSNRAASGRELADIGCSLSGVLLVSFPFAVSMIVAVFVVHLRTRRWARVTVILMACGVLACVALWTIPYICYSW